jgi:hypothetical protein
VLGALFKVFVRAVIRVRNIRSATTQGIVRAQEHDRCGRWIHLPTQNLSVLAVEGDDKIVVSQEGMRRMLGYMGRWVEIPLR